MAIEKRQVHQFVPKPEAADNDQLPYRDGSTGKLSYKTFAELLAWIIARIGNTGETPVEATTAAYGPEITFSNLLGHYRAAHTQTAPISFTKATAARPGASEHYILTADGVNPITLPSQTVVTPEGFTLSNGLYSAVLTAGTYSLYFLNRAQDGGVEVSLRLNGATIPATEEPTPSGPSVINPTASDITADSMTLTWTNPA